MKYPLLPYSQLVYEMLKLNPDVYTTRFSLRVNKRDVAQLRKAIEKSLRNHSVFSVQVDVDGMQAPIVPLDIFHGPYHSIDFRDNGETAEIDVAYNRILGDTRSELVMFEDICRAYQGLPLQKDYYWEYLQRVEQFKSSSRYEANRQWLEIEYGNISCPVHPQTDMPIKTDDFGNEGALLEDYTSLREAIKMFEKETLLPLTAFFSLASALAMMEYNHCQEAALTWAYDGRETEEEQHIYGSLHRDIPFKINHKSSITNHKSDLIRQARNQIRSGVAHSSYPLTLTKPHTKIWNYALNVLVRPTEFDMAEIIPFSFEVIPSNEEQKPAYALLDIEIIEEEHLTLRYRYSASHYKEESIKRFASLVRKYAEWLLKE